MPRFSLPFLSPHTARTGGSLGIASDRGGVCAAWLQPASGDGGRPRLMACRQFATNQPLSALVGWRRQLSLRGAKTNLLLSSDDYQLLPIDTLDLPPTELANAARWKVKDMIDYSAEDAAVACVLVPAAQSGGSPTRQALAVVAPREVVAHWMQSARQARCELTSIDIPELALRNLLSLVPSTSASGLLHVGLSRTTLVMVWQGELCTFRRFDVTAHQIQNTDPDRRQTMIERLALDLQRTCDAFERQFHTAALGRVWVTHHGAGQPLADELRQHVSLDVHTFALNEHLDIAGETPVGDVDRGIDFIPAIGAALRSLASHSSQVTSA